MVLEKPQGHDRRSAEKLSEELLGMFEEEELYRTDHYLAKSVVTNILPFRYGIEFCIWVVCACMCHCVFTDVLRCNVYLCMCVVIFMRKK